MGVLTLLTLVYGNISVSGHAGEDHDVSISDAVSEILSSHGLATLDTLNCDVVTTEEWERLGEAVMNQQHPDPDQHEAMDNMMGGEGSESLNQAHSNMGKAYLGCTKGSYGMMGAVRGTTMMGFNQTGSNESMMEGLYNMGFGTSSYGWGGVILFWLIAFAIIFFLVRSFSHTKFEMGKSKSALDILNERYVKGEIDKAEFDSKKSDL